MKITRLLRKTNLKVALLSIVLAIVLWFFKAMSNEYSSVISMPIKVESSGEYFPYGTPSKAIDVNVSGIGWNLFWHSFGTSYDTIFIPLNELTRMSTVKGREIQTLMKSKINGLIINGVKTERVKINHDRLAEKAVSLRVKKKYLKRYYFDTVPSLSLDKIILKGPKRAIDTLASSYTFGVTDSMLALVSPLSFNLRNEYPLEVDMSAEACEIFYSFKSTVLNTISVKVKYLNLPFLKSITAPSQYVKLTYKVNVLEKEKVEESDFVVNADFENNDGEFIPLKVDYTGSAKLDITSLLPSKIKNP